MRIAVLVLAGCGGADPAPIDAGDPPTTCDDTVPWAAAPPLDLGPTQETAVVALDGKIYILGGFQGLTVIDAVQIFDTATCTYSAGPALPKPVHHLNAAVIDGTIVAGGALQGANFTTIGDTWSWNPATDAGWMIRTSMTAGTQRGAAVTAAIDNKLFLAGGFRGGGAVTDVSVYDPALDQWTELPALPAARDHACGGAIAGKLYVAGGRVTFPATESTTFMLTPGAGWESKAAMITGRGGTACGVIGDRLIVAGGEGNPDASSGVFPEVEAYTAATDSWESLAPMVTPRHGMGAAASAGRLYIPGGASMQGFGAVATHEILTP